MGKEYVEAFRSSPHTVWSVVSLPFLFLLYHSLQNNQLNNLANKQLSEMTEDELQKRQKEMTVAVILIAITVIIMLISAIFVLIRKGFTVTAILPFAFLPLAIINFMSLKKIKAELASRKK